MSTHMTNICSMFQWNNFTRYRHITSHKLSLMDENGWTDGHTLIGTPQPEKCTLFFDLWPQNHFSIPTHTRNIGDQFRWNPSTVYRYITLHAKFSAKFSMTLIFEFWQWNVKTLSAANSSETNSSKLIVCFTASQTSVLLYTFTWKNPDQI